MNLIQPRRTDLGATLLTLLRLMEQNAERKDRAALRASTIEKQQADIAEKKKVAKEENFGKLAASIFGTKPGEQAAFEPYLTGARQAYSDTDKMVSKVEPLKSGELGKEVPGSGMKEGPALTGMIRPAATSQDVAEQLARARELQRQDLISKTNAYFSGLNPEHYQEMPEYHAMVNRAMKGEVVAPDKIQSWLTEGFKGSQELTKAGKERELAPAEIKLKKAEARTKETEADIAERTKESKIQQVLDDGKLKGLELEQKQEQAPYFAANAKNDARIKDAQAAIAEAEKARQPDVANKLRLEVGKLEKENAKMTTEARKQAALAQLGNMWLGRVDPATGERIIPSQAERDEIVKNALIISDNFGKLADMDAKVAERAAAFEMDASRSFKQFVDLWQSGRNKAENLPELKQAIDLANSRSINAKIMTGMDPKSVVDVYSIGVVPGTLYGSSLTYGSTKHTLAEAANIINGTASKMFTDPIKSKEGSKEYERELLVKASALASQITVEHGYLGMDPSRYEKLVDSYNADPRVKKLAESVIVDRLTQQQQLESTTKPQQKPLGQIQPLPTSQEVVEKGVTYSKQPKEELAKVESAKEKPEENSDFQNQFRKAVTSKNAPSWNQWLEQYTQSVLHRGAASLSRKEVYDLQLKYIDMVLGKKNE